MQATINGINAQIKRNNRVIDSQYINYKISDFEELQNQRLINWLNDFQNHRTWIGKY